MSEIKVRLSMTIPGAVMLSSQECEQNPKESYDTTKMSVQTGSKRNTEFITITTRKSKPAKQAISISKEAYDSMISDEFRSDCPSLLRKYPKHLWIKLSKEERLEAHLKVIADSFNALSYSYEILDD